MVLISGDVGQDELALSAEDRNTLIDQVSIVFHSAAILKMNSDMRTAVNINTVGTLRMLEMAKQMKKLEVSRFIIYLYKYVINLLYSFMGSRMKTIKKLRMILASK